MPTSPSPYCLIPGCDHKAERGAYCPEHNRIKNKSYEDKRGSPSKRGYTAAWGLARQTYLLSHPFCVMCKEEGIEFQRAQVVDHIRPHKGNYDLFWDDSNWQPLCIRHHSIKTVKEDGGFGKPVEYRTRDMNG